MIWDGTRISERSNFETVIVEIAVPFDKWPVWAKAIKQFSTPSDSGVGDTVRRIIGEETSVHFKAWFLTTFKKHCGCDGRQAHWNQIYSYA